MSLWSKVKKAVAKGAKVLPGISQAFPSSRGLANAAGTLQKVSGVLQGGGIMTPGINPGGSMPMGMGDFSIPSFPTLPGGGGLVQTGMPGLSAMVGLSKTVLPAVRTGTTAVVAAGKRLLPKVNKAAAKALGWVTVGALVYDAAGNLMGQTTTRRMNPLNARAARRAIRRIKSVRKIVRGIESSLPKAKCRR